LSFEFVKLWGLGQAQYWEQDPEGKAKAEYLLHHRKFFVQFVTVGNLPAFATLKTPIKFKS